MPLGPALDRQSRSLVRSAPEAHESEAGSEAGCRSNPAGTPVAVTRRRAPILAVALIMMLTG
jgi:hypothetical protein